ncbi:MAG: PBP1A family penicillin-binding protein [Acidobacteria bacterium]|nr:PBP1A family penicillin-binding protein [Acidobacteriota bacterium]MCA1650831.1 PBP1A family penicillin-binding protein [Acidobacteriota bacterium]
MKLPRRVRDRIAAVLFSALIVFTAVVLTWILRQGYAVHRLTRGVGDTWFLAADGRQWFRMDEHRQDVPLSRIPADLQHAFVAVEDHRFFSHPGVDPIALGRAIVRNLREPGTVEGGSTLTQQLARTLFLSNQKSYVRKIREAVLAVMIDARLSKEQILELYLNRIYLSAGVYGVQTMSQHLFGKPARDLNLAECALVAGLARAPSALSPWSNLDGAIERSHVVLSRMRAERFINEQQEAAARRTRIRIRPYPGANDPRGGYAKEFLRQQFRDRFGGDHPPDWEVQTTFVPELQEAGERAVGDGLRQFSDPELQAALVAVDPRTGNILALVGGRDFRRSQFNRATRSRRQPGSAFKPLLFAAALEHGFSPVSVLSGLTTIKPQGPDEWAPRNASGDTPDSLTLRAALIESNNRAATALQQRIGSRPVLRLASDVGLRDMPDVPSLSLGTGLVTPLDLTAAFAAFPNGGFAVRPRAIVHVMDADGGTALDNPVRSERVISPATAYQMVSMLTDVIDRGTGASARTWGVRMPAGGKTGTTDDFKDAWFVGFTSSIVVGVWVGFDQPKSIGRNGYGSRYALPIWSDFIRRSSKRRAAASFVIPPGLKDEALCSVSYLRPVGGCPTYTEYFKETDPVPGRLCPLHEGTVKQKVRRAVEDFFSGLGRKLKGILR